MQLLDADKTYAVEDPGYLRLTRIYQASGCRVRHVPIDSEGPVLSELASRQVDVLHLMPSHQFPTGRVTSIARRYRLLAWAADAPGRYLIEDDYDCEFRLAGKPIPPLAAIDASGRVIYTNTFSKSLSSALRLAYTVLPVELMEKYNRELGFYSSTVSSVDQVALARLLESGEYERHVMEEADAGLHCVLAVASPQGEDELAARLRMAGVPAVPVSSFAWCAEHATAPAGLRRLVVSYEGLVL